ncbi:MAG: hypothetical protein QF895_05390 [SAR86 cluster bacterium]|nr:hypothetical protein [SAR86 cluster bacterium]
MGVKASLLFLSLLLANNIWSAYLSNETGEEVALNDWILIDEIAARDKSRNPVGTAYKYCVITQIVDERNKTPSAYAAENKPHPLNAVGFAWFIVNGTPVQSFTTRYIFRDALTGRRDTTLPEGCEIKLQIEEGSVE